MYFFFFDSYYEYAETNTMLHDISFQGYEFQEIDPKASDIANWTLWTDNFGLLASNDPTFDARKVSSTILIL